MKISGILLFAVWVCASSFAAAPKPSPQDYHAESDEQALAAAEQAIASGNVLSERYTYFEIAKIYARQGKREQALDSLERALASRFTPRTQILHEPAFQTFADDERFRRISGQLPRRDFSRDDGWRYDIAFLAEEARRLHTSPTREAFSEEFERATQALSDAVPTLSDTQIRVKLQELLTLLHDGHSGVDIDQDARRLPVRLYFFSDGVFVIDATDDYKALIGGRVLRIGSRPIDELLSELPKYVPRDNLMGIKWRGPPTLTRMQFLQALGAADSLESATLTLERDGRKPRIGRLASIPVSDRELVGLVPAPRASGPPPLYLSRLAKTYWFEPIGPQTLYLQFNGVYNMVGGPSIPEFADALQAELGKGTVQNLIVDVRLNTGGDLGTYPPLLRVLGAFRASSPRHQIFCIIGRNTFSAAQAFIGDLERFVSPVFVGEPSGSSPNFTGESTGWFELPYSHTRANISERYHQHSTFPDDARKWIVPRIPVELSSQDYFSNRDPAVAAVLAVLHDAQRGQEGAQMSSELRGVSERWFQAWMDKDAATVERLVADDYIYIAPSGATLDRAAILRIIRSPGYRLDQGTRTEVVVRMLGDDAGVVRHRYQGAGSLDGTSFTDDHQGLMVWQKHAGEWRLVMEQNSFAQ